MRSQQPIRTLGKFAKSALCFRNLFLVGLLCAEFLVPFLLRCCLPYWFCASILYPFIFMFISPLISWGILPSLVWIIFPAATRQLACARLSLWDYSPTPISSEPSPLTLFCFIKNVIWLLYFVFILLGFWSALRGES